MIPKTLTVIHGCALSRDHAALICIDDGADPYERPNQLVILDASSGQGKWEFSPRMRQNVAVCYDQANNKLAILSRRGEVEYLSLDGNAASIEHISDPESREPAWKSYGYMTKITCIKNNLYVCGMSGQIYRRDSKNIWMLLSPTLRTTAQMENWFGDIKGHSSDQIYTSGLFGALFYNDGVSWSKLDSRGRESLTNIFLKDERHILVSGGNGTLLSGNQGDGFVDLSAIEDGTFFHSVAVFGAQIFLSADEGIFTYDETLRRIVRYDTGLLGNRIDSTVLEVFDGVMWSFGLKDVVRFDGLRWARFDHPSLVP